MCHCSKDHPTLSLHIQLFLPFTPSHQACRHQIKVTDLLPQPHQDGPTWPLCAVPLPPSQQQLGKWPPASCPESEPLPLWCTCHQRKIFYFWLNTTCKNRSHVINNYPKGSVHLQAYYSFLSTNCLTFKNSSVFLFLKYSEYFQLQLFLLYRISWTITLYLKVNYFIGSSIYSTKVNLAAHKTWFTPWWYV